MIKVFPLMRRNFFFDTRRVRTFVVQMAHWKKEAKGSTILLDLINEEVTAMLSLRVPSPLSLIDCWKNDRWLKDKMDIGLSAHVEQLSDKQPSMKLTGYQVV